MHIHHINSKNYCEVCPANHMQRTDRRVSDYVNSPRCGFPQGLLQKIRFFTLIVIKYDPTPSTKLWEGCWLVLFCETESTELQTHEIFVDQSPLSLPEAPNVLLIQGSLISKIIYLLGSNQHAKRQSLNPSLAPWPVTTPRPLVLLYSGTSIWHFTLALYSCTLLRYFTMAP